MTDDDRRGGGSRRIVRPAWLTEPGLARLLGILNRDGEEGRVVGGAVRNSLLDLPHGDIDVATTALPQEVVRRVEAAGLKAVPTGIEHGTVTVVVRHLPVEVTTLRRDVETYGRRAKVAFGRDWKADAERRDFTINALSITPDGVVHDYVGGLADLDARRVQFIGDPARRIREDYLRILRFFRFHAAYGRGALDAAGLQACIAARDGLAQLSRERVRSELLKLLAAPGAVAAVETMADAGLLGRVLAGVPGVAQLAAMAEAETAAELAPDAIRRLGALAVLIVEDAERLAQRLRLSNAERERLVAMADGWWRIAPQASDAGARALLYRIGRDRFTDRALLAWARSGTGAGDAGWQALATLPGRWTPPGFPLKARDLIARGVAKGPALGAALRAAEDAWIRAGFPTDLAALDAILAGAARPAPD